jgi:hypothetical protein
MIDAIASFVSKHHLTTLIIVVILAIAAFEAWNRRTR